MSIFEYDEEKHLKSEREYAYREGMAEGEKIGEQRGEEIGIQRGRAPSLLMGRIEV